MGSPTRGMHYKRLRNILRLQRVRYRCESASAFEKLQRKQNKIIDKEDARKFLSVQGVDDKLFSQSEKTLFAPFFMLTGGGLEAIDELAYEIAYREDESPDLKSKMHVPQVNKKNLRNLQSMPNDRGETRELKTAAPMKRQTSM